MSHITLVRHGQANSEAKDEENYDRLSLLGHDQAGWLGDFLAESETFHARLYTGTLRRHVETADGMATGLEPQRDARLNELEYFTLATLLEEQHGLAAPNEQADFAHHLPKVFGYWQEGRIEGAPETFQEFTNRSRDVIADISAGNGPALVVTSGGFISMVMAQTMNLDIPVMARVALAIMHTSMHRLFPIGGHWAPVQFNAVPHLDTPARRAAQTHI